MKNPPEAVSRFLSARNVVHMPDATDPSIVEHALRKRKTIRVLQIPGTIGKSQDLSTLDYPDIHMGDMDPDEADIFAKGRISQPTFHSMRHGQSLFTSFGRAE